MTKKQRRSYDNAITKAAVSMVTKAAKQLDKEQESASSATRATATQVASMLQVKAADNNAAPSISVVPEVKSVQFDPPNDERKARFSSLVGKLKANAKSRGRGKKKSSN